MFSPVLLDRSGCVLVSVIDQPQFIRVVSQDDLSDPPGHLLPTVHPRTLLPPHLALHHPPSITAHADTHLLHWIVDIGSLTEK